MDKGSKGIFYMKIVLCFIFIFFSVWIVELKLDVGIYFIVYLDELRISRNGYC